MGKGSCMHWRKNTGYNVKDELEGVQMEAEP